jgi:hypothetical protein
MKRSFWVSARFLRSCTLRDYYQTKIYCFNPTIKILFKVIEVLASEKACTSVETTLTKRQITGGGDRFFNFFQGIIDSNRLG